MKLTARQIKGVSKIPQVRFLLYSNTNVGLKGRKAHGWVAKICLRNIYPSKLEMSVAEVCEKIFLLLENKRCLLFESITPHKIDKKVREEFLTKYSEVLVILTIIVYGRGENPNEQSGSTQHPKKIGVLSVMCRKRTVGPIFFISAITRDVYQDIIYQFVSQMEKSERRSWLQQDSARPYVSKNTMSFLCEFFNESLISTNLWPPHRHDLSPLNFFLWGY